MKRLKRLVTDNDTWTNAECENGGPLFLLRFRPHLQDFIASKKYNNRLTILWHYKSEDSRLLPGNDELELMENIENILIKALENDIQSVLAFVYTGQNRREWHWYSGDIKETSKRINKSLSDFDKLPIELSSEEDASWSEYSAVLQGSTNNESEEKQTDDVNS